MLDAQNITFLCVFFSIIWLKRKEENQQTRNFIFQKKNFKSELDPGTEKLNSQWKLGKRIFKPLSEIEKKFLLFFEQVSYKNMNIAKNQFKVFI